MGGGRSAVELLLLRVYECMRGRKRQGRRPDVVLVLVFAKEERSQIELKSSLVLGCALFEGGESVHCSGPNLICMVKCYSKRARSQQQKVVSKGTTDCTNNKTNKTATGLVPRERLYGFGGW